MDAERVWLVHKGGFASASQLKGEGYGLPEGRVKIRLDHGGEILEVDEDDVEKVNFIINISRGESEKGLSASLLIYT